MPRISKIIEHSFEQGSEGRCWLQPPALPATGISGVGIRTQFQDGKRGEYGEGEVKTPREWPETCAQPRTQCNEHPDWTQDILLDALGTTLQEKWEPQRKVQPFPVSSPLPSGGWRQR